MICAYCKEDRKVSKEHIIPASIIQLFPECTLAFHKEGYYIGEAVIKDVCETCNNIELGKLDSYGKMIIENHFVQEYERDAKVKFEYDFNLLSRWLIKILFNDDRANKGNLEWYENHINYILNAEDIETTKVSLFAGLAINSSPMPAFWANNRIINIIHNPVFVLEGLFEQLDAEGTLFNPRKNYNDIHVEKLFSKHLIQFGSVIFIIFLWEDDVSSEHINKYEQVIQMMFPYKTLCRDEGKATISRCTHAYNFFAPQLVDSCVGMEIADATNCFMPTYQDPMDVQKELNELWSKEVAKIRKESRYKKAKKKKQHK